MPRTLRSHPHATWADFRIGADGDGPFRRNEKLAALCMGAVASWSQAETHLRRAVAAILGGSGAPEADEYLRSTKRSKKEALVEGGLPRLPEADRELFRRILSNLKRHGHERDDLAHGFWGDTGALPGALLWIDAKHVPVWFHPRGLADFNNNIRGWADKVRVYEAADFARMTRNNVLDATLLGHFHAMRVGYGGGWHRDRLVEALVV